MPLERCISKALGILLKRMEGCDEGFYSVFLVVTEIRAGCRSSLFASEWRDETTNFDATTFACIHCLNITDIFRTIKHPKKKTSPRVIPQKKISSSPKIIPLSPNYSNPLQTNHPQNFVGVHIQWMFRWRIRYWNTWGTWSSTVPWNAERVVDFGVLGKTKNQQKNAGKK